MKKGRYFDRWLGNGDVRQQLWLLITIVLLGAGLRFFQLDRESLWVDEIATAKLIREESFTVLWQKILHEEISPPLYFVTLWGWSRLWGLSEWGMRSFSAVMGSIALILFLHLARLLLPPPWQWKAVLLFALSPMLVAASQEARMYALLLVLWLWGMIALWQGLEGNEQSVQWSVIPLTLALYTHPYGGFLLLLWISAVGLYARRRKRWRLLRPAVIAGLLFLPWLFHWYEWMLDGRLAQKHWIAPLSWKAPVGLALLFAGWVPPFPKNFAVAVQGITLVWSIAVALSAGILWGAVAVSVGRVWTGRDRSIALLHLWLWLPLVVVALLSLTWMPLWVHRYFIGLYPAALLLAVAGLDRLSERTSRWLFTALNLALVILLLRLFTEPHKEQWREAVRMIEEQAQPGDAVLFQPGFLSDAYQYYARRTDLQVYRFPVIPRKLQKSDADTVQMLARQYDRLWYVFSPLHQYDPAEVILQTLRETHAVRSHYRFYGVEVLLHVRQGSEHRKECQLQPGRKDRRTSL